MSGAKIEDRHWITANEVVVAVTAPRYLLAPIAQALADAEQAGRESVAAANEEIATMRRYLETALLYVYAHVPLAGLDSHWFARALTIARTTQSALHRNLRRLP